MEEELIWLFKNFSLELIIGALGVCILTAFIKWPIKKATSRLKEDKRKCVNGIIVFIPLILSVILCILYSGITAKIWFNIAILKMIFSVWLLSLSLYAISSKIWLLIKSMISGKTSINSELTKDTIKSIKENIKALSLQVKTGEETINNVVNEIQKLLNFKKTLEFENSKVNQSKLQQINNQLKDLGVSKLGIENKLNSDKSEIKNLESKLYITKGEN